MLIVGLLLIVLSGVFVLGDSGSMADKMPTQVLPRRYARYPFAVGITLALLGLAGIATA